MFFPVGPSVSTRSVTLSASLKPNACIPPSKRPSVTRENNSDRRPESDCHAGHSECCQMYLGDCHHSCGEYIDYSPHRKSVGAMHAVNIHLFAAKFISISMVHCRSGFNPTNDKSG
jgi:hypothetical protein